VIAVDDASTDDTSSFGGSLPIDQRLRIVCLTRNVGPGGARNVALRSDLFGRRQFSLAL
jgi:glycosyltransferase involved in cell wall biosynthesis